MRAWNRPESGQDCLSMMHWTPSRIIVSSIVHTEWSMSPCYCLDKRDIWSRWPISRSVAMLLSLVLRALLLLHGDMTVMLVHRAQFIGHVVRFRSPQKMLLTHSSVCRSTRLLICQVCKHLYCCSVMNVCSFQWFSSYGLSHTYVCRF